VRRHEHRRPIFRAISHLLGDALSQFAKLFQNEVDLAKAELGEKVQQIGGAVGCIAAGAVLVHSRDRHGAVALSAALIAGGWSQPVSYLISAIVAAVLAGILFCGRHEPTRPRVIWRRVKRCVSSKRTRTP
jgi:hypothetical protein